MERERGREGEWESGGRYRRFSLSVVRAAFAALAILALAGPLVAEDADQNNPVETAKEALSRGGRFPWYDRQNDDVRRLSIVPRDTPLRDATWADNSAPKPAPAPTGQRVSLFGGVLQWIGLTALVLLLGFIAFLIASAFLKEEVSESVAVRKVVESRRDADRVEALPIQLRAAAGDFLSEARRLYEAGRYSEAIVYLFSHQLVELDKKHVVRLAKGKTNRQYLRETRQRPTIASILETTMIAFEDAFFGKKTISREVFERSWQQLDRFETELHAAEGAAA